MRDRILASLFLAALASGCSTMSSRESAAAKPPAQRDDEAFAQRVLAHWNQNAAKLQSVVCEKVDVTGKSEGQPYTLDARIAYQAPNNFRLMGYFMGKSEADLGSNSSEVWFWVARSKPPAVYFCKREDLADVRLPMPFHPDDLIEVLGAAPLNPDEYRFEMGVERYVSMVAPQTAPNGERVLKRFVIDRHTGRPAAFQVWDVYHGASRLLAEAVITDYHVDATGVFLPRRVKLKLPDADTDLTLSMKSSAIRFNEIDREWASTLFRRGTYLNSQVVDLGEEMRSRQAASPAPGYMVAQLPTDVPTAPTPPSRAVVAAGSQAAEEPPPASPRAAELFEGIQPGSYRPARAASLSGNIERTSGLDRAP